MKPFIPATNGYFLNQLVIDGKVVSAEIVEKELPKDEELA
jgi:hypothetical protein